MYDLPRGLILDGHYHEALKAWSTRPWPQVADEVVQLAFDTRNPRVYGFAEYVSRIDPVKGHKLAATVLYTGLNPHNQAHEIALGHARKAVELAPQDLEAKAFLLLFHELAQPLISDEEAEKLAWELLAADSGHSLAMRVLDKLG